MERPSTAEEELARLSQVLWRQRTLVQMLAYRLEVQELVIAAGRDAVLPQAVEEVESTMDDIRAVEQVRLEVVHRCARALGVSPEASLNEIRERADSPWDFVLGEHQAALLTLVAAAEEFAARTRELANRGLTETRALLEHLSGGVPPTAYGRRGTPSGLALPPALVDRDA